MIDINDIFNGTFSTTRRYDCSPSLYDQIVVELELELIDEQIAQNVIRFLDQSAADMVRRVTNRLSDMPHDKIGHTNLRFLIQAGIFQHFFTRMMHNA